MSGGVEERRFDPHDERIAADPYSAYLWYREQDPVHWGKGYKPGADGCWYLFRHSDVVSVLRDRRFVRQWPPGVAAARADQMPPDQRPFWEVFDRLLLSSDPPEHRRLRTLVSAAFTPQTVASYRPFVEETTRALVAELPDEFDLVTDFAAKLSSTVICTILGVPVADGPRLGTWITQFGGGIDLRKGPAAMAEATSAATGLVEYFGAVVAERRKAPRDDLISGLIAARDDADRLTEDELLAMLIQLIFAGHETTLSQIGLCVVNLLHHPDQLDQVLRNRELVAGAVAESLRLNGSVQTAAARKPLEDVLVGDRLIKAGQPVIAFVGAANRDPAVFTNPELFDLTRDNSASVSFGAGIHYCLGAALAKLEVETAISTLLTTHPTLQLGTPTHPAKYNLVLPGFTALPVHR